MVSTTAPDFVHIENNALAGKYMATFWHPIALSRDYVPGKLRRIKILGTNYTLYRGEDGGMHLTQDRCPHRGTSLAYGSVEGDSIRCRYHGWKFDKTGRGEEFPAETASYVAKVHIKTYPTREYLGMVFGYFGEGEPPPMWEFPEFEDETRGELLVQEVVTPYNFFQRMENDHDEVHAHYTHKFMPKFGLVQVPKMSARETEYGMTSVATRPDGRRFGAHCFMPNILVRQAPVPQDPHKMSIHLTWRVPIDNVSTLNYMVNRIDNYDATMRANMAAAVRDYTELARRAINCEISLDDIDPSHPLLPVIEDTVCIGGQGVIADREHEHLGVSDVGVVQLRRIWMRELAAFRDGMPLKQWYRPSEFAFDEQLAEIV